MQISIVTAYFNRKTLFKQTLQSLKIQNASNLMEVIAVDDGSDEKERIEDLCQEFPFLRVIRLEKEDKWYINPCVPFNVGIAAAKGEKIILQNPECYHMNDVVDYVNENLEIGDYLSFGCFSLDKKSTENINEKGQLEKIQQFMKQWNTPPLKDGEMGWYNHSVYRPGAYHFCTAIMKQDLQRLGGFDERYAFGVGYDDDEFIWRVKQNGLSVKFIDHVCVLHQNHYKETTLEQALIYKKSLEKNKNIFETVTQKNNLFTVKYIMGMPHYMTNRWVDFEIDQVYSNGKDLEDGKFLSKIKRRINLVFKSN